MSASDATFGVGAVGIGSFNDSVYFDDLVVTEPAAQDDAAPTPADAATPGDSDTPGDAGPGDPGPGDSTTGPGDGPVAAGDADSGAEPYLPPTTERLGCGCSGSPGPVWLLALLAAGFAHARNR